MPLDAEPAYAAALTAAFHHALAGDGDDTAAAQAFIARVLEDYRPEELPELSADALADALAGFWRLGAKGAEGPVVRLTRQMLMSVVSHFPSRLKS